MKLFAQKARSFSAIVLLLALVFTLGLTVCGCGSSDDTPEAIKYTNIVVKHNLVYERSVSTDIKKVILSGYNESGTLTFEPTSYDRTTTITKSAPVTTTSIRLAYFGEDGSLEGLYVQKVALEGGVDYVIDDPAWQDADSQSFVKSIALDPEKATLEVGDFLQFSVVGTFNVNGSSLLQNVTKEVSWTLTSDMTSLKDLGEGSFKAVMYGESTITADYAGVTADASVLVLGTDGAVRLTRRNVYPDDNDVYCVPLSVDEQALVQKQYDTGLPFTPACFSIDSEMTPTAESASLAALTSDENVCTAEIVYETDGFAFWPLLVIHPQNVGVATVTVEMTETFPDKSKQTHRAQVQIEVVDLPLMGFNSEAKEYHLDKGREHEPEVNAVFGKLNDEKRVYVNCAPWLDSDLPSWKSGVFKRTYTSSFNRDEMISLLFFFPDRYSPETGVGDKVEVAFNAPEGYQFYKDPNCVEPLGTEFVMSCIIDPAVPLTLQFDGGFADPDPTIPYGIIKQEEGKTTKHWVFLVYTDGSKIDVTNDVKYELVNTSAIAVNPDDPWEWTGLELGYGGLITVSLGETAPELTGAIKVVPPNP